MKMVGASFVGVLSGASFFFQAEDGIRDRDVTGVQTCALPISALADQSQARSVAAGAAGMATESARAVGGPTRRSVTGFSRSPPESVSLSPSSFMQIGRASRRERGPSSERQLPRQEQKAPCRHP